MTCWFSVQLCYMDKCFTVNFYTVRVLKNQNVLENLFENLYEPQGEMIFPLEVLTDGLYLTYYSTVRYSTNY